MRKRAACRVVGLVAALSGMCAASPYVQAKTTINFLGNWYNVTDQVSIFKSWVKQFNESQSQIVVKLTMGGSEDKLRTMMAAGTAPDVVEFDRYLMASYAREGLFAPTDQYLPRSVNLKADFLPATVQEASWKGRTYAVPMDTDIRGLFWNKRLFAEAGLDPASGPKTWAQLSQYSLKLTKRGSTGKVEQAGFIPWQGNWYNCAWVWSFGGDYYDYATGKPSLDTPASRKALAWLADWAKTQYTPVMLSTFSTHDSFSRSKVAMEAAHYGALPGHYEITNPKIVPDVAGGEVPHPDGGQNGTWSGGLCYVVPSGSRHKAEAGQFIAWLSNMENQMRWYKEIRQLPPTHAALAKAREFMQPLEQAFVAQLPVSRGRAPFSDVLLGYLDKAADDAISGRKSPEAALAMAQANALAQHPGLWKEKTPYNLKAK